MQFFYFMGNKVSHEIKRSAGSARCAKEDGRSRRASARKVSCALREVEIERAPIACKMSCGLHKKRKNENKLKNKSIKEI